MGETLTALRVGEVLAGKYRVDRVLGAGGMGIVVAAHHLGLDTRVAVKLLLPEMVGQAEVVARFAREARAAARITNEHVARVFDVGALADGAPYMVMEFLEGADLRQWLEQRGPLGVAQAVDFVVQACEAVAEAHDLGIVHRDLKPANLFCIQRADGSLCIKVLDFGISKIAGATGSLASFSMTSTAAVMGTPFYMSPEQMESARSVDGRTDIWALGVILFELLTGRVPFAGETLPEVCVKIATHAPPPVRDLRADVPAELEAVVLRCLEKDRNKRFATVAELTAALAPLAIDATTIVSAARSRRAGPLTPVPSARASVVPPAAASPASFASASASAESLGPLGNTKAVTPRRTTAVIGVAVIAVTLAALVAAIFVAVRPSTPAPASAGEVAPAPASPALTPAGAVTPTVRTAMPSMNAPPVAVAGSPGAASPSEPPAVSLTPPAPAAPEAPTTPSREPSAPKAQGRTRRVAAPASPTSTAASSPAAAPTPPAREPSPTANPFDERL